MDLADSATNLNQDTRHAMTCTAVEALAQCLVPSQPQARQGVPFTAHSMMLISFNSCSASTTWIKLSVLPREMKNN